MLSLNLLILGAGGFAKEVLWAARRENRYLPAGFLDDIKEIGVRINNLPVAGTIESYFTGTDQTLRVSTRLITAVGNPNLRETFVHRIGRIDKGLLNNFITVIDPSVKYSEYVDFGVGSVITAGCIITSDIKIGSHVNLNLDCTVGHDTIIEDYCNISPGVHISGHCHLESKVDIGTGANILPGIRIGAGSIIGAGAVVSKDVPPLSVAVGVPAKVIKSIG